MGNQKIIKFIKNETESIIWQKYHEVHLYDSYSNLENRRGQPAGKLTLTTERLVFELDWINEKTARLLLDNHLNGSFGFELYKNDFTNIFTRKVPLFSREHVFETKNGIIFGLTGEFFSNKVKDDIENYLVKI